MSEIREIEGIRFAKIEPGSIWIGSTKRTADDESYRPYLAKITKPFWIGTTPITQQIWHKVMGEKFHEIWTERINNIIKYDNYTIETIGVGPDFPMHSISYEEISTFNSLLSKILGTRATLPTEIEWELAAQSSSGAVNNHGAPIAIPADQSWFIENFPLNGWKMQPVGMKPANQMGIHDIYGLIWEIVRGQYDSESGQDFDNSISPNCCPMIDSEVIDFEPKCNSPKLCMAKGGSIYHEIDEISTSSRISRSFAYYYIDIGFRVAIYE